MSGYTDFLAEYGVKADGHTVYTCGPHTGHSYSRIAFCDTADAAHYLASIGPILAALKAIVDFCDDPEGSEKGPSLAVGLSGLLPEARAAISTALSPTPAMIRGEEA